MQVRAAFCYWSDGRAGGVGEGAGGLERGDVPAGDGAGEQAARLKYGGFAQVPFEGIVAAHAGAGGVGVMVEVAGGEPGRRG